MNVPLCIYGKATDGPAGVVQAYRILACAPDFPAEARAVVERIAQSFRWRADGREAYPPHHAIWPLADSWIGLRFLDAGQDDRGRPHTLRLEAAWISGCPWSQASQLLAPDAWPSPSLNITGTIRLTPVAPLLEMPPTAPTFIDPTPNGECPLLDPRSSLASSTLPFTTPNTNSSTPTRSPHSPPEPSTMSSFSTPDPSASNWRWIAALLVITGAVVLGARAYYSNQIKTLNTIIQDLQTHADQQAEELTRTRATLTQAEQHKARLSEELRQAESRAFARLPGSLRKTAERLSAQANRLDQLSVNIGTEMEVLEQTLTRPSAPAPDSPSEAGPR